MGKTEQVTAGSKLAEAAKNPVLAGKLYQLGVLLSLLLLCVVMSLLSVIASQSLLQGQDNLALFIETFGFAEAFGLYG